MGWDSFGLPAENAAIREGGHPREIVERNIAHIRSEMRRLGWVIDWDREVAAHEPEYYRWTQWLFLKFFEAGLAYRKEAPVNWCPKDQTVVANEYVIDGKCERCGTPVVAKNMEQWFFRITAYADKLLEDLALIDWPEKTKTIQRNWIGRSEGAEVLFRDEELDLDIPVFTTRPDTLFGATFFVVAPEHPLVEQLGRRGARLCGKRGARSVEERQTKEKDGVFTGHYVVNPVNGERIPVWVADYVLMDYGTGAIMAVPAHDERDREFAERYDLAIRPVIDEEEGVLVASGEFTGLPVDEAHGEDRRVAAQEGSWRLRDLATACATGRSRASATGAARSRSSTARTTASFRCPRISFRSCCPRSRTTGPWASRRSPRTRSGSTCRARSAASPRGARRTRWTRSSTRPGTSCATATRTTTRRRGTGGSSTTGCRSTSTSAASTTRRGTCFTRASSSRR